MGPGCTGLQPETAASPALAAPSASRPERPCRASGSVLPCRTANHSTPRLRACAISASVSFAALTEHRPEHKLNRDSAARRHRTVSLFARLITVSSVGECNEESDPSDIVLLDIALADRFGA